MPTQTIQLASTTRWNFFSGTETVNSSSQNAYQNVDNKPPIVKTPRGKWRPPTNYSREVFTGPINLNISARVDFEYDGRKFYVDHRGPSPQSVHGHVLYSLPAFPGSLKRRLEQKALAKVKDSDLNLAVAFGERAATADLVANSARRIARGVRAARKLDIRGVARALGCSELPQGRRRRKPSSRKRRREEAHNLWLEYQYGWKPILSDTFGAVDELHRRDNRFKDRYRCKCTASGSETSYIYLPAQFEQTYPGLLHVLFGTQTRERYRGYCRLDWVLDNPVKATLSEMGITNPALVAWELVPFSFVVDWFVPIGSYLNQLDVGTGWTFKGGSFSTITRGWKRRHVQSIRVASTSAWNQKPTWSYSDPASTRMRMTRATYSTPPFTWKPSFDGDLTKGSRVANAIALLTAAFK